MEKITQYPRPAVTVDLAVFTILDADLKVLLVKRDMVPFKGQWALPGGFVRVREEDQGEDLEEAARRELAEETGLPKGSVYLEQLRTFGKAGRDPRMRVISVAHFALVRPNLAPFVRAGGDVREAEWFSTAAELPAMDLAFDHDTMLQEAVTRIREDLLRTNIAFELVPQAFSIAELRAVYEVILGRSLDPGNFRRRVLRMVDDGILERTVGKRITTSKPAKVYRFIR